MSSSERKQADYDDDDKTDGYLFSIHSRERKQKYNQW